MSQARAVRPVLMLSLSREASSELPFAILAEIERLAFEVTQLTEDLTDYRFHLHDWEECVDLIHSLTLTGACYAFGLTKGGA